MTSKNQKRNYSNVGPVVRIIVVINITDNDTQRCL